MVNQSINIGLLSCGLGDDVVPERVGKDENHREINCQFWGRDTIASGALLSDALEYFVCD
jgi:hypothetical protein